MLPPRADRRAGIAATLLVHALLILGWTMTRKAPSVAPDPPRTTVQWIRLPAPATPAPRRDEAHPQPVHPRTAPLPGAIAVPSSSMTVTPAASGVSPPAATAGGPATDAPALPAPPAQSAGAALLERARRDAGAGARARRTANTPDIVAPLALLAPGMDELVNNTGDGARRTRVVTRGGTYCMTERSPATSIDTIEKHGKWRQTNCSVNESTPNGQAWRTARD